MKSQFRIICLVCALFSTFVAFSQDGDDEGKLPYNYEDRPPSEPPKSIHPISIRFSGGVPNPLTSRLFRHTFVGIYEANLSVNLRIGDYLYAGLGFRNTLLSVSNRNKFGSHTKMQMNSGFVRVGYDKYHSGRVFSSFYMQAGYTQGLYTGAPNYDLKPQNPKSGFAFFQPTYGINFFGDEAERLRVGFYGGYNYMLWQFDPVQINLKDVDPDMNKYGNKSNASYWVIGLEMYVGLGKTK
ncbi:MAG: hypothetical protein K0S33_3644 [Bacteroidetes bacterium]|nr:hypothetical protein [Bacteroidota bacterium]